MQVQLLIARRRLSVHSLDKPSINLSIKRRTSLSLFVEKWKSVRLQRYRREIALYDKENKAKNYLVRNYEENTLYRRYIVAIMHKFDRNIGLRELTFIDHECAVGITSTVLLQMEEAGNISMRGGVVSRRKERRAKEEMNCARSAVRGRTGQEGEGGTRIE